MLVNNSDSFVEALLQIGQENSWLLEGVTTHWTTISSDFVNLIDNYLKHYFIQIAKIKAQSSFFHNQNISQLLNP